MARTNKSTRTRWHAAERPIVAWLVGPWHEGEFAATLRAIEPALGADGPVFATLAEATAAASVSATEPAVFPPPEIALVAQPRPGYWRQDDLDRLQAAAPLVQIVVVAGSWCEGELRTGRPLTAALRLYWYELPAWWGRAAARRAAGLAPHWSRTGDAGLDATEPGAAAGAIAVDAIDVAVFEALDAALRPHGWTCTWTQRGRGELRGAIAGIFDGGQLEPGEVDALRAFCDRVGTSASCPAPVVALLDFPRSEHIETLHAAGAAAMLGKPYAVASLVHELRRVRKPKITPVPLPLEGRG